MSADSNKACNILLVEDNPGDIRLTEEVMRESSMPIQLHIARDGVEAMKFLNSAGGASGHPLPDLILLDLNLPRKDGREVLSEVKSDPRLKRIPVLMLTTSKADRDVQACYDLHVNCYLNKPLDLDAFVDLMQIVEKFWLNTVLLPPRDEEHHGDTNTTTFGRLG